MVSRTLKTIVLLSLSLFVLPFLPAQAADIEIHLDRDTVEEGESFNLVYTAYGDVDGDPDFSPLEKNFRILQRSQRSNIQFINGSLSSTKKWLLMMMPKKSGKLMIPGIRFGRDRSEKKKLNVKKTVTSKSSKKKRQMFLEIDANPKTTWVQSQILFTIRIYHLINLNLVNASLSEMRISDKNAIMEKLGDDLTYEKRINGSRYKVFEKRFAIFPQTSGKLVISPVEFEGQYVNSRRNLQSKRLKSRPVKLTIKARPAKVASALASGDIQAWLPATAFTLKEKWSASPDKFIAGEPVTRTITMTANGLMGEQFPEISPGTTRDIKLYPDQPQIVNNKTKTGVIGMRQEKIAYIPVKAGVYQLPKVTIPWWNVKTGRQEIATIPAREIRVGSSADNANSGQSGDLTDKRVPQSLTEIIPTIPALNTGLNYANNVWFWISLFAMGGWLITIRLWWRSRTRSSGHHSDASGNRGGSPAKRTELEKRIKIACYAKNEKEVKNLLLSWARNRWPENTPTSLPAIAKCSNLALSVELDKLGKVLYSGEDGRKAWDGPAFWKVFEESKSKPAEDGQKETGGLQPLFKHSA